MRYFIYMSDANIDQIKKKTRGLLTGYSTRGPKREQAYHQLRRLLILQQIPQGTRMAESKWTYRLGVNRSALREAFARLEAEGLIELGPKNGYFVPSLKVNDIQEILALRFALEGSAIEIICQSGLNTPQHLKPLQETCELLEWLVVEEYELSTVEADYRFHEELIRATGNKRLTIAYRHAPLLILHPDTTSGPQWAKRVRRTLDEHRAILKAIFEGNVHNARELLRSHLTGNKEHVKHASLDNVKG
ncbi:MAG: GntR family transcriptional regulator [Planctomycetota bacterium]|nr:MAG: GntR family transcriptional regulator [Planctomycetota bacterium]